MTDVITLAGWFIVTLIAGAIASFAGFILHELSHYSTVRLLGGTVQNINMSTASIGSMQMEFSVNHKWKAILVAYAPTILAIALSPILIEILLIPEESLTTATTIIVCIAFFGTLAYPSRQDRDMITA